MADPAGRAGPPRHAARADAPRTVEAAGRARREQVWEQFIPAPTGVSRYPDAKRI